MAQTIKHLSTRQETWVPSLGWEDSLEKEMATHSVLLPRKSHGRRSLVQATVHGVAESDTTEQLHFHPLQYSWASFVAQLVKNLPAVWETWVRSLGREDILEKGKTTHSSIMAWRIPWTMQRIGQDWAAACITLIKIDIDFLKRNPTSTSNLKTPVATELVDYQGL